MLYKINEGHVKSDEGYTIKLGRQHLSYIGNDKHSVTLEVEDISNPHCLIIYINGIDYYWHPPYQHKKLNYDDIEKLKIRIDAVVKFLKINYKFI